MFLTYFSTHNITLICKLVETNRDKMFLLKNYLSVIAIIFLLHFFLLLFSCHQLENDSIRSSPSNLGIKMKLKQSKSRVLYYPNTTGTFNVILQAADIESNPGPGFSPPKCSICTKTVRCNEKQLICEQCFESTHADVQTLKTLKQTIPHYGHVATVFVQFYYFSVNHCS